MTIPQIEKALHDFAKDITELRVENQMLKDNVAVLREELGVPYKPSEVYGVAEEEKTTASVWPRGANR